MRYNESHIERREGRRRIVTGRARPSMKIVRYQSAAGTERWGLTENGQLFQLDGSPFDPRATAGDHVGALANAKLLAPVAPSKVVCIGRNYAAHAAELGNELPSEPLIFYKPPSSLIGPGDPIVLPPQSQQVEHEGELAMVIGRRARHVSEAEAMSVVLGFSCANDVTARDIQRREKQWARAKGFDSFCPVGPWIVRAEALDPTDLLVQLSVNGELRQSGRTSWLIFALPRLIAEISAVMTLEAGDLILTGTPAGVGPLHPGDRVAVEIEGIGALVNPVVGTGNGAR